MTEGLPLLFSIESEEAVLGAVLLNKEALEQIADLRLKPGDFYRAQYERIFKSMQRIYDAGGNVDLLTVKEDLRRHGDLEAVGGAGAIEALSAAPPVVGHVRDYARRVKVLAGLREENNAALALVNANAFEDSERREEALAQLMLASEADPDASSDPKALAALLIEHIDSEGAGVMELPFAIANSDMGGGFRPGGLTLLGGHSSHGKTAMADQITEYIANAGHPAWAYINEMSRLERACRAAAKISGVDGKRVLRGKLDAADMKKIMAAIPRIPFGITDAVGWTAGEIARDIRRSKRKGIVLVDMLHEIPYDGTETGLAENCRLLSQAAKLSGCHVLATVHLSEKRVDGPLRKPPTLGEIRASGSLKNIADNVLFVWRKQDPKSGFPQEEGFFYAAKVRGGTLWSQPVLFLGRRLEFVAATGADLDLEDDGL